MNASMQFLLSLETLEIMGVELELHQVSLDQESVNLSLLI